MTEHLAIFALSFAGIWIGSGLAVRSVERLSQFLKASSFTVSFLVLGVFASMSELSVGVNAIVVGDPEIFVGNLIGASIVLLLLIVPLLALIGTSIRISPEFQGFNLRASLIVIALPVLLVLDGTISRIDSIIAVVLFVLLLVSVQTKRGFIDRLKSMGARPGMKVGREVAKTIFGVTIIFIASRFVVQETLYFSNLFSLSPFLISLLVIALGTNIPELSFVLRSALSGNKQVAFGGYIGSASFNTFLLGLLALIYGKPIALSNSYVISLLFLVVGLVAFYYFARTKNTISRKEGVVLVVLYTIFICTEIALHLPA